jgi:hypothetical protein
VDEPKLEAVMPRFFRDCWMPKESFMCLEYSCAPKLKILNVPPPYFRRILVGEYLEKVLAKVLEGLIL